jgi:hypothetical protein
VYYSTITIISICTPKFNFQIAKEMTEIITQFTTLKSTITGMEEWDTKRKSSQRLGISLVIIQVQHLIPLNSSSPSTLIKLFLQNVCHKVILVVYYLTIILHHNYLITNLLKESRCMACRKANYRPFTICNGTVIKNSKTIRV